MKFTAPALLSFFSFVVLATANVIPRHDNHTLTDLHEGDDHLDETPGSGGDYVVLVDNDDPRTVEEMIVELGASMSDIKYVYDNENFKGFAGSMSKHCATRLANFSGILTYDKKTTFYATEIQQRTEIPWGLQRVSQRGGLQGQDPDAQTFTYTFDNSLGEGVDIYIVDTGVNVDHIDFGDRARFGFAFDGENVDGNGHGTHCAGTAASSTFGVASKANIIAVKVLGADGSGSNDDIIKGLDWISTEHAKRKNDADFRGTIISMSLGSPGIADALDTALASAIQGGMHVSVAAGNARTDACLSSPGVGARDGDVISVGAIDINDRRAGFSNFGACVTTYAPGARIISTFIDPADPANGRRNIINTLSGTSMACPHVTGLMASYLSLNSVLKENPRALKQLIVATSEKVDLAPIRGDPSIVATNLGIIENSLPNRPEGARRPTRGGSRRTRFRTRA